MRFRTTLAAMTGLAIAAMPVSLQAIQSSIMLGIDAECGITVELRPVDIEDLPLILGKLTGGNDWGNIHIDVSENAPVDCLVRVLQQAKLGSAGTFSFKVTKDRPGEMDSGIDAPNF